VVVAGDGKPGPCQGNGRYAAAGALGDRPVAPTSGRSRQDRRRSRAPAVLSPSAPARWIGTRFLASRRRRSIHTIGNETAGSAAGTVYLENLFDRGWGKRASRAAVTVEQWGRRTTSLHRPRAGSARSAPNSGGALPGPHAGAGTEGEIEGTCRCGLKERGPGVEATAGGGDRP
jgi:hypothetical protein